MRGFEKGFPIVLARNAHLVFVEVALSSILMTGGAAGIGFYLRVAADQALGNLVVHGLKQAGFSQAYRCAGGIEAVAVAALDRGMVEVVVGRV